MSDVFWKWVECRLRVVVYLLSCHRHLFPVRRVDGVGILADDVLCCLSRRKFCLTQITEVASQSHRFA